MAGTNNWPIQQGAEDYFRQTNKRLARMERMSNPMSAADLLGPGMSSQAVLIIDWNDEIATFNGFFYSFAAAYNAPVIKERPKDPNTGMPTGVEEVLAPMPWTGMTIAREDGTGMQQVWNTDVAESMYFRVRNYTPNPVDSDAPVVFSEWRKFATSSGFIGGEDLDPGVQGGIQGAWDKAVEAIDIATGAIGIDVPTIRVFRQPTMPVSTDEHTLIDGDFWFDTSDNNHMYSYDGTQWVDVQDQVIIDIGTQVGQALTNAQAALDKANDAINAVGAASGAPIYSNSQPVGTDYVIGQVWYDTDDGNKQYRYNGGGWSPVITGWLETNPTPARGVKITTNGFVAYNATGAPVATINGLTGDIAILGTLTAGSNISGATITGVLQTSTAANTGIKMVGSGLFAYGGGIAQTTINGTTGRITTSGSLFVGGDINGANVTVTDTVLADGTTVSGVIQTSGAANRGVKINKNGMVFYTPVPVVTPTGTLPAGSAMLALNGLDGSVSMMGNLTSGSVISGAVINGSEVHFVGTLGQVHIDSSGLTLKNALGATILDANTGVVRVTGTSIFLGSLQAQGGVTADGLVVNGSSTFNAAISVSTINGGPTINGGLTTNTGGSVTLGQIAGTGGPSMVLVGNGGVLSRGLPITYGVANSGGQGFRYVRVPN